MTSMSVLIVPEADSPAWWTDAYLEATTGKAAPARVIMV
jgi:hypothetical protein